MSDRSIDPRTPVLVGVAQATQRTRPEDSLTALQMIEQVSRSALADAQPQTGVQTLTEALDTVLVVGFTIDAPDFPTDQPKPTNPPRSLSRALGIAPHREIYTYMGGNTPQMAVNRLAEDIAQGRTKAALLTGAEFLNSYMRLIRQGADLRAWGDDAGTPSEIWGDPRPGTADYETAHGLNYPVNTYPLFENAIRHARGRGVEEHMHALGRLFSPFTKVASENPHSWFPTYRSAEEIATVTEENRLIGFPYTKYMNAIIQVDMMAALVMTSVEEARRLGIPESRWVYLHGCADATDIFNVTDRINYHSSPAIRGMGARAFDMAGWSVDDLDHIDLYSCFPSAVEIGCAELGIAEDDPRGLTVTGGLPYFGGPGNNYVMHSIATMAERLRAAPGTKGLVTANGWFVTKHSMGLYSTTPVTGGWQREAPSVLQAEIDAMARPEVILEPQGEGFIETYTVVHARTGPRMAIVIGRKGDGRRFVATTPPDEAILQDLMAQDSMGRPGHVTSAQGGMENIFTPA